MFSVFNHLHVIYHEIHGSNDGRRKNKSTEKKGKIKQREKSISLTSIKYHDEGSYSLRTKAC